VKRSRLAVLPRLTILLLLTLSACASYRARPIDPNATLPRLLAKSLKDPRLLHFIAAAEERAGDAPRWNLDTLTLVALYERPDMPIASAELAVEKGGEITAKELPNPALSLEPTYNTTTSFASPWKDVGPIVTFLIDSYGARPARIARARARVEAAREALSLTAWKLRATVRSALIPLWAVRDRLSLASEAYALAREYKAALEERYRAGMVSAASVNVATVAESRAAIALAAARRSLRLARVALAAALGLPQKALKGVRLDWNSLDHPRRLVPLAPLTHIALSKRPDLLVALSRYAAAQAALRLAIARQYPALDIGPGYHYDQGDNEFILAVSLPLPILNQNQGPIASARAARRRAAGQFLASQAKALAEIERATTDWRASEAERGSARRLEHAAREAAARARTAFAAGAIGRLRLLGAERALIQAKEGSLSAAIDERGALGELEAALYHRFL
jgi:outer membrane protein, heavy metal efflux system